MIAITAHLSIISDDEISDDEISDDEISDDEISCDEISDDEISGNHNRRRRFMRFRLNYSKSYQNKITCTLVLCFSR